MVQGLLEQQGHVASMGEVRNAYKILVRKHEVKRPHRRLGVDGRIL
jgi:hypothetical protein